MAMSLETLLEKSMFGDQMIWEFVKFEIKGFFTHFSIS